MKADHAGSMQWQRPRPVTRAISDTEKAKFVGTNHIVPYVLAWAALYLAGLFNFLQCKYTESRTWCTNQPINAH